MAGDVVGHFAELAREIGAQRARLVPQHQIFERIEHVFLHFAHERIVRKQQRQLLLKHQHAGWNRRDQVVAGVDQTHELRDVDVFQVLDGLQIAQFELRHPAALLLMRQRHGDAVVLEHGHQVRVDIGFVAIAITGCKQRHLPAGRLGRHRSQHGFGAAPLTVAKGIGVIFGHRRIAMHAERLLEEHTASDGAIRGIHDGGDDGDPGQRAYQVGGGQYLIAQRGFAALELDGLGAQHQVGKIDVPRVRRHVRAFGHVAHVAQVAMVHDIPISFLRDAVHLARGRGIDQIE